MLNALASFLKWNIEKEVHNEWIKWENWQKIQAPVHYEKSEIFHYYLTYRPDFQPPFDSVVHNSVASLYYSYCFGDFTVFLVNPTLGSDVLKYIAFLLDFYDVCKGFSRRVIGDPYNISILRTVLEKRNLYPLYNHDFSQYGYDYSKIHAHTVVQYSLSTLIMRFIGNFLYLSNTRGNFLDINIKLCQEAFVGYYFGYPKKTETSSPIYIQKPTEEFRSSSWPRDNASCLRCKICNRVTENFWGNFQACIDCHLKRICSICSLPPIIISSDNLPKCISHQPN
jgi:hypothetical protein